MKISCPNPSCDQELSGTGHSLDHLKSRLGISDTTLRRHDARGDVDLLGRAVEAMSRKLELDNAFNGVKRHTSLLPIG